MPVGCVIHVTCREEKGLWLEIVVLWPLNVIFVLLNIFIACVHAFFLKRVQIFCYRIKLSYYFILKHNIFRLTL